MHMIGVGAIGPIPCLNRPPRHPYVQYLVRLVYRPLVMSHLVPAHHQPMARLAEPQARRKELAGMARSTTPTRLTTTVMRTLSV